MRGEPPDLAFVVRCMQHLGLVALEIHFDDFAGLESEGDLALVVAGHGARTGSDAAANVEPACAEIVCADGLEVLVPRAEAGVSSRGDESGIVLPEGKDWARVESRKDTGEGVLVVPLVNVARERAGVCESGSAAEHDRKHGLDGSDVSKLALVLLEDVVLERPEGDVLDADGDGAVSDIVVLDLKDAVAMALAVHELVAALPVPHGDTAVGVEADTEQLAAFDVECQRAHTALVESADDAQTLEALAVPDADARNHADLARGDGDAVGMHGERDDVVVVVPAEDALRAVAHIEHHTHRSGVVHQSAACKMEQVVSCASASVAIDPFAMKRWAWFRQQSRVLCRSWTHCSSRCRCRCRLCRI
eukprot:comp21824_c0_seq1/m.49168 comp21824_c0_seq1/g.49168  ORF comp21824_c0_seq1/g.49168 comp21824_c0_seq1/m.49168 type:complete len:362 (+) comp21824_c0_seq1:1227-2312(+)